MKSPADILSEEQAGDVVEGCILILNATDDVPEQVLDQFSFGEVEDLLAYARTAEAEHDARRRRQPIGKCKSCGGLLYRWNTSVGDQHKRGACREPHREIKALAEGPHG